MRTSDIGKRVVGLLSLGKSDFEAIEPLREDRFFKEALGLSKVPGSVWLRQRLEAQAGAMRDLVPTRRKGGALRGVTNWPDFSQKWHRFAPDTGSIVPWVGWSEAK